VSARAARVIDARPAGALERIGRAATGALYDELALHPKPGLVSFVDNGSHADMTAATFLRSLFALRRYFPAIAALGADDAAFAALERAGIAAEARMLAATGGVNTHRGAIFTLGLLCAAAGWRAARGLPLDAAGLRATLRARWGEALAARRPSNAQSHGQCAVRRHGLRGASDEAALGLPALFDVALPALRAARAGGAGDDGTRLHAFFHVLAVLDDTNLVHRGGLAGLRHAQRSARAFLAAGGALRSDAPAHALAIHADFVRRRLSPGGTADVLACACWLERIGACGAAPHATR
jgi:triphosphoribosyl-dephospho-CoA synthase